MRPDELKRFYEEKTLRPWNPEDGVLWLNKNYADLGLYTKTPVLQKTAHINISDKAGWLSQQQCLVCHPDPPISVISLRIRPESWQSLDSIDKNAFKAAMSHRLVSSPHITPYAGRICLTFLFVCSANRKIRDLDNMAKLMMDSLKNKVMADDKEVDHLNLMRLVHEGDEEFVFFRISSSKLNDHQDVVDPAVRHSWAGAEALDIEDFKRY